MRARLLVKINRSAGNNRMRGWMRMRYSCSVLTQSEACGCGCGRGRWRFWAFVFIHKRKKQVWTHSTGANKTRWNNLRCVPVTAAYQGQSKCASIE